jgi:type II secretory pathway predicted ATPase ExeA
MDYCTFFGFAQPPFRASLKANELLITPQLQNWKARFDFIVTHKLWGVLTGEVGAGKSTAMRWALEKLPHPEYKPILVTGSGGSVLETYRRILIALGQATPGSRARMWHTITQSFQEIAKTRVTPILVIDEASLLPLEVFKELHTLSQFECDSKPIVSVILMGQEDLLDKLSYPSSRPLASRITARMHLLAGDLEQTIAYAQHHLKIAGLTKSILEEATFTALHQAAGGIPRNINNLLRCALVTAAAEKRVLVTAEDIRIASTELFLNH